MTYEKINQCCKDAGVSIGKLGAKDDVITFTDTGDIAYIGPKKLARHVMMGYHMAHSKIVRKMIKDTPNFDNK